MPPKGKSRKNTPKSEPTKNLSEKDKLENDPVTIEEVPDEEPRDAELPAAVNSKKTASKNKKGKGDEEENCEVQVENTSDGSEEKTEPKTLKKGGKMAKEMKIVKADKKEGSGDEEASDPENLGEKKIEEKQSSKKGKKKAPEVEVSPNLPKKKSKNDNTEKGAKPKKQQKAAATTEESSSSGDDFETSKPSTSAAKKGAKPAPPAKEKGPKPLNRSVLQLKVVLRYINPPIWRRIQVLNNDTFDELHASLQEAMGWQGNHSYQFIAFSEKTKKEVFLQAPYMMDFGEKPDPKAHQVKLSRYLNYKGDRVVYVYDLGDSWEHDIVVERVLPPPPPKAEYPKIKAGKRACPPEDCGSYDGYEHLLEVYKNPEHEEYEELITDWLGEFHPGWEPEKFEKKNIFRRVWMWVRD